MWAEQTPRREVVMYKRRNVDRLYLNLRAVLNSAITDSPSERKASEGQQEATEKNIFIYLFIYCNWVATRWQWLFYM